MKRWGGECRRTMTSVAVLARHLPARIKNGTSLQRHESICQPDGREGLDLRVGGDPFFLAVADVLAADDASPDRAGGSPARP